MRIFAVLILSFALLLPGMMVPAAKAFGYAPDAERMHHVIDGEPQIATVFGLDEEDSDCHDGFNVDPTQCAHAHMVMAAIPVAMPEMPKAIHAHFDIVRGDSRRRIASAPPLRPPQA